jgi:hypothetical protein
LITQTGSLHLFLNFTTMQQPIGQARPIHQ